MLPYCLLLLTSATRSFPLPSRLPSYKCALTLLINMYRRRTRQSGPLGELFDHGKLLLLLLHPSFTIQLIIFNTGVDACNTAIEVILFAGAMNLGQSWRTMLTLFGSLLTFYVQTWEEYHTHTLTLGLISGPVEGIMTLIIVYALTGALGGGHVWSESVLRSMGVQNKNGWIPSLLYEMDWIQVYMTYGGVVLVYNTLTRYFISQFLISSFPGIFPVNPSFFFSHLFPVCFPTIPYSVFIFISYHWSLVHPLSFSHHSITFFSSLQHSSSVHLCNHPSIVAFCSPVYPFIHSFVCPFSFPSPSIDAPHPSMHTSIHYTSQLPCTHTSQIHQYTISAEAAPPKNQLIYKTSCLNVINARKSRSQPIRPALLGLAPFFTTWFLLTIYLALQPIILNTHLIPFIFYVGLINAYSVGQIITAHLVKADFPFHNVLNLPLVFAVVDSLGPWLKKYVGRNVGWPSVLGDGENGGVYQVAFVFLCVGLAAGVYGSFVVSLLSIILRSLSLSLSQPSFFNSFVRSFPLYLLA